MSELSVTTTPPPRPMCNGGTSRPCQNVAVPAHRGKCNKHYDAWLQANGPVPGETVFAHIELLRRDHGFGWRSIAEAAGVGRTTVFELGTGRRQWASGPVAAKILAVRPDARPYQGNPIGAIRRIRALKALGYTDSYIADRLGTRQGNLWKWIAGTSRYVTPAVHDRIAELFAELAALPRPEGPAAERARKIARRRGWLPPLAWDDDAIDDPAAEPISDALHEPGSKLRRADFRHEYEHFRDVVGLNDEQIAARLGITAEALAKRLLRVADEDARIAAAESEDEQVAS